MKVLVTGANGYLGRGIVKEILDMGNSVVATDFSIDWIDKRAIRKACDLFEVQNPYQYFEQPDVLLHLAWRDGFIHDSDAHIDDLPKHYTFIKTLAESKIKTISVMGSMHEVGFYEGSIDEKTPCNPENFYGIAKNALREITRHLAYQNGKTYQWLRGYYIVGNSKFGSSVFSKLVLAEEEGKQTFPFTMGINQYDFTDYKDFCYKVALSVIQDKIDGIINICSGRPEKLSDRVERFIQDNGYKIQLQYGVFPDRPYDSKAVWGNSSKIEEIIKGSGQ